MNPITKTKKPNGVVYGINQVHVLLARLFFLFFSFFWLLKGREGAD